MKKLERKRTSSEGPFHVRVSALEGALRPHLERAKVLNWAQNSVRNGEVRTCVARVAEYWVAHIRSPKGE